jgi:hypothetical protein
MATSSTSFRPWPAAVADMAKHEEEDEADELPEDIEAGEEASSEDGEVPPGAAVFPEIPAELGVNPLLLAVVHALVFLAGSDEEVVAPPAADEAVQAMANYLIRLEGKQLASVREDMACLTNFARQSKWPKQLIRALKNLLNDCGLEVEEDE